MKKEEQKEASKADFKKGNNLQNMTEQWMQMERKTIKQREMADEFYEKNLLSLIEKDFIQRNMRKLYEEVEYLIMSVGTSYEPLVLNIILLKPKKILFLCTEATEKYLDKIVHYCELAVTDFQKTIVSETNPNDIYREIKKAYLCWRRPEKVYIDFTGGTKAMSAAAAMAGAVIDVQLVYVGTNEYLTDFRKPKPGSETLFFINNPIVIFGDLEIEKAFILFEKHNYTGARIKLEELKENVPEPDIRQQLEFAYLLAQVYEAWDSLDFLGAYCSIQKLNKIIKRDNVTHSGFLLMDMQEQLLMQENILAPLSGILKMISEKKNFEFISNLQCMVPLMFTMLQNALVREEQGKYDMSTLLLYRLLELIEQSRLSKYNLYVSNMDYLNIKVNYGKFPEWKGLEKKEIMDIIARRFSEIKKNIFGKGSTYMPEQMSLLEGYILLLALDDEISKQENGRHIDKLKRIRSMVYLRNNSIFAHGLGPVSYTDFLKFKEFVINIFKEFCDLEKINYKKYCRNIQWVNPFDSIYYTGLEER